MARAVSEPAHIVRELGEPKLAGVDTLYRADDLTILNLRWGPGMVFKPHDHRMWAVIGIYGGCEQNFFFRRSEHGLTQHGTKELNAKDTVPLGAGDHPRGDQSAGSDYGGDPRLRRRFLRDAS